MSHPRGTAHASHLSAVRPKSSAHVDAFELWFPHQRREVSEIVD
jgi:hypothetical protein